MNKLMKKLTKRFSPILKTRKYLLKKEGYLLLLWPKELNGFTQGRITFINLKSTSLKKWLNWYYDVCFKQHLFKTDLSNVEYIYTTSKDKVVRLNEMQQAEDETIVEIFHLYCDDANIIKKMVNAI